MNTNDMDENQSQKEITICAKCKWYNQGKRWHEQFFNHPEHRKKQGVDFVTGKVCFGDGGEEPRRYARDINTDGKCETFESKRGWFA